MLIRLATGARPMVRIETLDRAFHMMGNGVFILQGKG